MDCKTDKELFLTFDDGPTPNVTGEVISILDDFMVEGTFFCVGENIVKYPKLFNELIDKGHAIGNHTYNHLNGWNANNYLYLRSIINCASIMPKTNLFRPPYGKIKMGQAKVISKKYKVIMWDVISGDFDKGTSKEKCLSNVLKYSESGSIIVFHDSLKAKAKVLFSLPKIIRHFLDQGYKFSKIEIK